MEEGAVSFRPQREFSNKFFLCVADVFEVERSGLGTQTHDVECLNVEWGFWRGLGRCQ